MNSLYKTVPKTLILRLSAFSHSRNYCSPKFTALQPQGAVVLDHNSAINRNNNWKRPSEIPFQSKVSNWVNFIGKVQIPVQFLTLPNGDSWAGTVLSQDRKAYPFWIPIIFEGDMAHTAAMHLKLLDIVHVAGQLTPDPLPINLTNGRADIQVKVHDIHFVRGYDRMKYIHR